MLTHAFEDQGLNRVEFLTATVARCQAPPHTLLHPVGADS
jgi:hypothetical protein